MSKKRGFSMAIAAMMLFSATAYGAEVDGTNPSYLEKEDGKFNVTYTKAVDGSEYMIWVVKETEASTLSFTQDNVLYINQNTASGNSVTFDGFLPMKSVDSTVLVSGQGMETPVIIGYINGESNKVCGEIGLQGRTDNFGGVTIAFYQKDPVDPSKKVIVDKFTTVGDSKFETILPDGTYEMVVSRPGFLSYTNYTFEVKEGKNWEEEFNFELIPGDMNNDGIINGMDFIELLGMFGSKGDDVSADFDGNSIVNGVDFTTFLGMFGKHATEVGQ